MNSNDLSNRMPWIEDLVKTIKHEILQNKRPATEILLDDVDLRHYLRVSKRTTASLREKRIITYSKIGGKIYYRLSDVLSLIEKNKVSAISETLKIKL